MNKLFEELAIQFPMAALVFLAVGAVVLYRDKAFTKVFKDICERQDSQYKALMSRMLDDQKLDRDMQARAIDVQRKHAEAVSKFSGHLEGIHSGGN